MARASASGEFGSTPVAAGELIVADFSNGGVITRKASTPHDGVAKSKERVASLGNAGPYMNSSQNPRRLQC